MTDLADDARVIEAATAGPWVVYRPQKRAHLRSEDGIWLTQGPATRVEDALFIARARTRYPALVAEVRELRRVAYVLAMEILQSELYETADDELRAAMEQALPQSLRISPQEAP